MKIYQYLQFFVKRLVNEIEITFMQLFDDYFAEKFILENFVK